MDGAGKRHKYDQNIQEILKELIKNLKTKSKLVSNTFRRISDSDFKGTLKHKVHIFAKMTINISQSKRCIPLDKFYSFKSHIHYIQ